MTHLQLVLGVIAFAASDGPADLRAVPRTVRKEPAYASKAPKYCLLVFGPKADTRVWLVLDLDEATPSADGARNVLYVDRNGDGDLTGPGEKVPCVMRRAVTAVSFKPYELVSYRPHFEIGDVIERDGTRHTGLTLDSEGVVQQDYAWSVSLTVAGRGGQSAGGYQLKFADRPADAPVIHFNGPLTLRAWMGTGVWHVPISYDDDPAVRRTFYDRYPPWVEQRPLVPGRTGTLTAQIGTPGLGLGTFVSLPADNPLADEHPEALISWPAAAGTHPPVGRVVLDRRTCGSLFSGEVRVPGSATAGRASVLLRLPGRAAAAVDTVEVTAPGAATR